MPTVQARTGERRRAATQQDLLDATTRLLRDGRAIADLTVADIVREAGVVRTTFYLHFKDKLELVGALLAEQVRWIEEAGRTGQQAQGAVDLTRPTIRLATRAVARRWAADHAVLAAIIATAETDPGVGERWRAGLEEIAGVAEALFAEHWARHPARAPGDPAGVAAVLTWMVERACHQLATTPERADTVGDALAEVVWRVLHPAG